MLRTWKKFPYVSPSTSKKLILDLSARNNANSWMQQGYVCATAIMCFA